MEILYNIYLGLSNKIILWKTSDVTININVVTSKIFNFELSFN
jgi:hypothetical protein